jgi:MFS superfamily sulfate permease-like transporter
MNNHTTQDVLAKLREQNDRSQALLVNLFATAKNIDTSEVDTLADTHSIVDTMDAEHDFDAYESSDHNMRQQEWEHQAREVAFIEFHVPAKLPITEAQRIAANKAIEAKFPGVQLGANLSQRKACEILASYIGLDNAAKLMASV